MVFKKEFIKHYMELYGKTKSEAFEDYESVFGCLADLTYGQGEDVCVKDFGTFRIKQFAPKKLRQPTTGDTLELPARKVVTFTQSKLVNEQQ